LSITTKLFIDFLSSRVFFPEQILTANINTYSEVENAMQPIIMAQKVRIYPYSQYDRTVCLRAELIGCIWDGESLLASFFTRSQFLFLESQKTVFPAPLPTPSVGFH
jgi:hypothetical protein